MEIGATLHAKDRREWRAWLRKHHRKEREIWLVYYTKASGVPFVAYDDAVEEALCFGWIDSLIKKHGPDSRAQRFTPRRPGSRLSELNKERVRRLIELGKMTATGLAAAGDLSTDDEIPAYIERALRKDPQTWANFQSFPAHYRRIRVGWIHNTGDPGVRKQRLDYLVKMTKAGKRFGTMA